MERVPDLNLLKSGNADQEVSMDKRKEGRLERVDVSRGLVGGGGIEDGI